VNIQPLKSLKRLAQDNGESKSSARRAKQLLKVRTCKTTVVHVRLAGFIFAVVSYSLSSNVRSIRI
jgi:hypothetical protein